MKKRKALLIAMIVALSTFTSCASFKEEKGETEITDTSASASTEAAEKETEAPKDEEKGNNLINAVIEKETEWIKAIEGYDDLLNKELTGSNEILGNDYIWFQDFDMDGEPDFITLSKYISKTDIGSFRYFNIYNSEKNDLYSKFSDHGTIMAAKGGFQDDTFGVTLWKGKNDEYHYISEGAGASVIIGDLYELNFTGGMYSVDRFISVYGMDTPNKGVEVNQQYNKTYAEGVKFYDDFFADLTSYETTVKKIQLSEYEKMTKDEKLKALTESYNAWSYSEKSGAKQPLSDVIEQIRKESSTTGNAQDYAKGNTQDYAEVLDYYYNNIQKRWSSSGSEFFYGINGSIFPDVKKISYMWEQYNKGRSLDDAGYILIDMNNDNVNELLVTADDGYGNRILDIFTINSGNIIHLAATGERDVFSYCSGNVIMESGSSGAASSAAIYYKVENAKLTPIEGYEIDANTNPNAPYYYSDEFEYNAYNSHSYYSLLNRKNITEDEFNNRKYNPDSGIFSRITPFSKYSPTKVISEPAINESPLFTGYVVTEKDPLNVRKTPSTSAEILGRVDKGAQVDIYAELIDWYEIRYNGQTGYVSKKYVSCGGGKEKPVIYLYPESKTDVSVKVHFKDGGFTCTYPEYNSGWNVTAYPDGKIINKSDNDEYSYLYWEGDGYMKYNFDTGFVVKREDTAKFLKEKLSYMGLTPKEYNEFIVYWLTIRN